MRPAKTTSLIAAEASMRWENVQPERPSRQWSCPMQRARAASPPAAILVRGARPRPALPVERSVCDLDQRGHAPADPGGRGRAVFSAFLRSLSDDRGAGRRASRTCSGSGKASVTTAARDLHAARGGSSPGMAASFHATPPRSSLCRALAATRPGRFSRLPSTAEPILEANTPRLFSRLLAYRGPVGSASAGRMLWAMAEAVLRAQRRAAFNQGADGVGQPGLHAQNALLRRLPDRRCAAPMRWASRRRYPKRGPSRHSSNSTRRPSSCGEAAGC